VRGGVGSWLYVTRLALCVCGARLVLGARGWRWARVAVVWRVVGVGVRVRVR